MGSYTLLTTLLEEALALVGSGAFPSWRSVAPEACIADRCTLDSDLSKKLKQTTGNHARWLLPCALKLEG